MEKVNIAIYGVGFIGQTHFNNLLKIQEVNIVAVCDYDKSKAENLAEKVFGIKAYDDFNKMISENTIDGLFICIPPFAHNGEVEEAAAKGIHVFLEKPIALTINRARSMYNAIKSSNIISQVGYHQRFGGAIKKLKAMIDADELGKPCLFDGIYACNSLHAPWWREQSKSGSQILEQAIHTYDMAMYLFGTPATAAGFMNNVCHKDVENYTIEDVSASIIRFKNGAIAGICATNCAVPMIWDNPYTVIFEKATVHFKDPNNAEFIFTDAGVRSEVVQCNNNMYFDEVKEFISCVLNKTKTFCSIEDGYNSLLLVDGVVRSAKAKGEKINFNNM